MKILLDLTSYTFWRTKRATINFWKSFQQWRKERIIARALDSKEGREALARSMVEPIRRSLEYQAIGRKIFGLEPLPEGAVANYKPEFHENGLQKYMEAWQSG